MSFFGLDKWPYLYKIMKQHGGVWKSFMKVYLTDQLKDGKVVGKDKYGNTYYENKRYFWATERWMEFDHEKYGVDFDASQIPPEWYGWMHHKTDYLPDMDPFRRNRYKWMQDHVENLTGTEKAYVPYSTVPPKIELWSPKNEKK